MLGSDWYSDTDPRALEVFLDLQRRMSADRKIALVFQMTEMVMKLGEESERRLHPEASDREIFLRAASRRLDRATMIRVYGWDPESPS
jgi:hypothetical protein